jgi:hypothetical protein
VNELRSTPIEQPTAAGAPQPSAVDALAEQLRSLGAETQTERRVKRVVPWVSSLVIHGGMIVLAFALVTAAQIMRPEEEAILIVADFEAPQYDPLKLLSPNQDRLDQEAAQDLMESPAEDIERELNDLEADPLELLSDAASRSNLAEFAPQARDTTARFAGLTGTNARRIAYVVDASGSMIGAFQIVLDELARSIDALVPEQSFSIIFFQRGEALIVPPSDRLVQATGPEKVRALKWIEENVVPADRSNPIEALRAALALEPDVIFLLSNGITGSGQFEIDQDDLLAMLRDLNPVDPATGRRQTQIQTVQFLDPDPLDTLRKIALEHSSEQGYRFLSREELGIGR